MIAIDPGMIDDSPEPRPAAEPEDGPQLVVASKPRHDVLGLHMDYLTGDQLVEQFISLSQNGRSGYCCIADVHVCVRVHDSADFSRRVNGATFVVADSVILQRATALLHRLPYFRPTRGADLMLRLCAAASKTGVPIALVGGRDQTALDLLGERLRRSYPALDIAFAFSPPFRTMSAAENNQLDAGIRRSGARIVFVGLGCPKQETWMSDHSQALDAMLIGVGAAFDYNAGTVTPPPTWIHRAGLEWLYRLLREPKRLWRRYARTAPKFVWLLILSAVWRPPA